MEFRGTLKVRDEGVVNALRERMAHRLGDDGFMIVSAVPLRARRNAGLWRRLRGNLRRILGGGFESWIGLASEVACEFPLSGSGRIAYGISVPGISRALLALLGLATFGVYWTEGPIAAVFMAFFGTLLTGLAIHYSVRRGMIMFLGLRSRDYADHRLTMG
jgi:hypothetical protein